MPKDRMVNSSSFNAARVSPYACSSKNADLTPVENEREWEETRCAICMEHPHNAVLLLCSSGEKGCLPYMCDTSYRHSNCLDQFCKLSSGTQSEVQQERSTISGPMLLREIQGQLSSRTTWFAGGQQPELVCPLCRGQIKGWIVVEAARKFMNSKQRSCSLETCNFNGNYGELRKHARLEHPSDRPAEADPQRLSDWRRLEIQRDVGDTVSAYETSLGENVGDPVSAYETPLGDLHPPDEFFDMPADMFDFLDDMYAEREDGSIQDSNLLMDLEFEFSFLNDFPYVTWTYEEMMMMLD